TLHPNLGVVDLSENERFVLADIPGLIEGASEGAGLGHRFLGHTERCAVLLHLVDATEEDVLGHWRMIRAELEQYGHDLGAKPEITVLNKADAVDAKELAAKSAKLKRAAKHRVFTMSGATGQGVDAVLSAVLQTIQKAREAAPGAKAAAQSALSP
ncbi:MAG: GTPase, partial [Stellaceae bacterium]